MYSIKNNTDKKNNGFTLIELIAVIIILGVLAAVAIPRFVNLTSGAKIAALQSIEGVMISTITIVRMTAITQGLSVVGSNPAGGQSAQVIDFGGSTTEVDWRNLCPESRAELGDALTMIDFINLNTAGGLTSELNNQYTLVGYDIPGFSVPTDQGCYIIYDSFGDPNCTVELVTDDC